MTGTLLQMFPLEKRSFWQQAAAEEKRIQEIRLRAGRPILIMMEGRNGIWIRRAVLRTSRHRAVL